MIRQSAHAVMLNNVCWLKFFKENHYFSKVVLLGIFQRLTQRWSGIDFHASPQALQPDPLQSIVACVWWSAMFCWRSVLASKSMGSLRCGLPKCNGWVVFATRFSTKILSISRQFFCRFPPSTAWSLIADSTKHCCSVLQSRCCSGRHDSCMVKRIVFLAAMPAAVWIIKLMGDVRGADASRNFCAIQLLAQKYFFATLTL